MTTVARLPYSKALTSPGLSIVDLRDQFLSHCSLAAALSSWGCLTGSLMGTLFS